MGHHTDGHRYAGQEPVEPYGKSREMTTRKPLSDEFRQVIHRDDGTKLAELSCLHGRALMKMYALDGIDHRQAAWSLTPGELQRLGDAADKTGVELSLSRGDQHE